MSDKSIAEIKTDCSKYELVPGDIRHIDDYLSIVEQFRTNEKEIKTLAFPISRTDELNGPSHFGDWKYGDSNDSVTFAMWNAPMGYPGFKNQKVCTQLSTFHKWFKIYVTYLWVENVRLREKDALI